MYCPNCGRYAASGQRFCKSCGLNLLAVSQSLSGHVMTAEEQQEHRRRLDEVRHGIRTMITGIGLFFFLPVILKTLGAAIGALVFFIGLGRVASATVFISPRRTLEFHWPHSSPEPSHSTSLPMPAPPERLETMPPSVTEHTTIRLEQPEYRPPPEKPSAVE